MFRIKKAGFSLIELLVVISIAGLIIAAATTSYITSQRQARDARRKEDMRSIQASMEQFYAINNRYANTSDGNLSQVFTGNIPTDPQPGHTYTFQTSRTEYCICASLEGDSGNANLATTTTCIWNTSGTAYCIQNQQ